MGGRYAFIDEVKIWCESGRGGDGMIHFRREKYVDRGGPDGGDGGDGGDVIIVGNSKYRSLLHLKYNPHHRAGNGKPGGPNNKKGARGKDVIIEVPPGTVIKDAETGEVVCEITAHGEKKVLLKGGKGGRGNAFFKSATRQAPDIAEKGQPGTGKWFIFELKLLADAGLVGLPNAGKSSLLRRLSAARPKVASYPFTTLEPHLGVVSVSHSQTFVLADIPGIIENAHEGRGLGIQFLRHIERTKVLIFMLAPDLELPVRSQWELLRKELRKYNTLLLEKPFLIVFSKSDLIPAEDERRKLINEFKDLTVGKLFVSSATGEGLNELVNQTYNLIQRAELEQVPAI